MGVLEIFALLSVVDKVIVQKLEFDSNIISNKSNEYHKTHININAFNQKSSMSPPRPYYIQ